MIYYLYNFTLLNKSLIIVWMSDRMYRGRPNPTGYSQRNRITGGYSGMAVRPNFTNSSRTNRGGLTISPNPRPVSSSPYLCGGGCYNWGRR